MENDEKDRHVAAAAVKAGAQVISTSNLKDFAQLPMASKLSRLTNSFATCSISIPRDFVQLLRDQAADLVNPPMTLEELLQRLARAVPDLVAAVREHTSSST